MTVPIWDTFSKRKRRQVGAEPDVYRYDDIPRQLRVQVIHIWSTALGEAEHPDTLWKFIHDTLARELGVFSLGDRHDRFFLQCQQFLQKADTDSTLDLIEISFFAIEVIMPKASDYERRSRNISQEPADAIAELNARFKEHGIGYQFESGHIIRVDSQHTHAEIVKPALRLLSQKRFAGAQEEFLKAHEHYRHGRHKEAVAEALKSFESVMKIIASARKWTHAPDATAKKLIDVMFQNDLVPKSLQSEFTALASVLESGLPTVRNKTSGHGQGTTPIAVPSHLAAFALHLAAANILFLADADKAMA